MKGGKMENKTKIACGLAGILSAVTLVGGTIALATYSSKEVKQNVVEHREEIYNLGKEMPRNPMLNRAYAPQTETYLEK